MKCLSSFASVILFCIPAAAQQPPAQGQTPTQRQSIEVELLELEQDVDKSILREALLLLGRQGMMPSPQPGVNRADEEVAALRDFVARKKQAIIARAAEMEK